MLSRAANGFGSLALAALLAEEAKAEQSRSPTLGAKRAHHTARAKRVIFLFMKGGPSHVDTFERKHRLDRDHGKNPPFELPRLQFAKTGKLLKSPWSFRHYGESGIEVSELFPNVAKHVDDICFLHGLHGTHVAHGGACLKLHTGSDNLWKDR